MSPRGEPSVVISGIKYVAATTEHALLEERLQVGMTFLDRVAGLMRERADRSLIARRLDAARAVLRGVPPDEAEAAFCIDPPKDDTEPAPVVEAVLDLLRNSDSPLTEPTPAVGPRATMGREPWERLHTIERVNGSDDKGGDGGGHG